MSHKIRYFNGFIIASIVLFGIAIVGLVKGDGWLSEPGMPVNRRAELEYLVAAAVMLVNGIVSVRLVQRAEKQRAAQAAANAESGKA